MNIRFGSSILALTAMFFLNLAYATDLDLHRYQRNTGAITVGADQLFIDPYFANKALIVAKYLDLDISKVAYRWIDWALLNQSSDGRFSRYCVEIGRERECKRADADDAMLALWMQLLANIDHAPTKRWQRSFAKASDFLDALLFDSYRKIYVISRDNRVGLLMDNVEVYGAFVDIAQYYGRLGDHNRKDRYLRLAKDLQTNIRVNFWVPNENRYRVSTQQVEGDEFYPHKVAQLFPLLAELDIDNTSPANVYQDWMKKNRGEWLDSSRGDFSWGLVAVAAYYFKDFESVHCWLRASGPKRHGPQWNVLEEAIYQGLSVKIYPKQVSETCS